MTIDDTTGTIWTREEFVTAFNKVCDPKNWKMEVGATIDRTDFDVAAAATVFFTGSELTITGRPEPERVEVYAAGYYLTIGA